VSVDQSHEDLIKTATDSLPDSLVRSPRVPLTLLLQICSVT
jgi:hypothetical protein